jgi:hypothetical protein
MSFIAEMIRSDGDRTMLYVDGWMRRLERCPKSGRPSIFIWRPDKRVIWALAPDVKTYSQTKMPDDMERAFDPDAVCDWSENGTETIDGRKCRRFVGRYRKVSGPVGDAHEVCFVDVETGMRRRVATYDARGELALTVDYLNAKVGPPSRDVFEMPAGYKRGYNRRKRTDG